MTAACFQNHPLGDASELLKTINLNIYLSMSREGTQFACTEACVCVRVFGYIFSGRGAPDQHPLPPPFQVQNGRNTGPSDGHGARRVGSQRKKNWKSSKRRDPAS